MQTPAYGRGLLWLRCSSLSEHFAPFARGDAHAQGVELDKSTGVGLVVRAAIFFEGGDIGVEQRVIGLAPRDDHVALVQFHAHHAVHVGLGGVDHLLQHQTLRAPPETVVDQAGVFGHQLVFQVSDFAVQGDRLDGAMALEHDGAAGGLIAAARLHADEAVLDDIQTTDAVLAADAAESSQHGVRAHVLAVDGNDIALAVGQLDIGGGIRRCLGGDSPFPHVFFVLGPGVFQHAAFIGDMQQVGVHGVRRLLLAVTLDRDFVLGGVVHQLLARQQVPLAPRGNDFHAGLEGVGTQFETHLVVTLAGSAVGDGVGTGLVGDFDQALGDQRTGNGGAQQVFAFVDGVGAEHRVDEIAYKFFAQVVDVDFLDAHGLGLGAGRLDFLTLTEIRGKGHHFAVIGVLQPLEDHGSVQATGICQDYLVYVGHAINSTGLCGKTRDSTGLGGQFTGPRQPETTKRQLLLPASRVSLGSGSGCRRGRVGGWSFGGGRRRGFRGAFELHIDATILRPVGLAVVRYQRVAFAMKTQGNVLGRHAVGLEVFHHGQGAAARQGAVDPAVATVVGMAIELNSIYP